jgi:hypothetical protein
VVFPHRAKKKEDLEGEALTRWLVACAEKMFKAVLEVIDDSPRYTPLHHISLMVVKCESC